MLKIVHKAFTQLKQEKKRQTCISRMDKVCCESELFFKDNSQVFDLLSVPFPPAWKMDCSSSISKLKAGGSPFPGSSR